MTDTVLISSPLAKVEGVSLQHKPVVDLGTRVAHISMAIAFLVSYLTAESEYWRLVHVYSGYALATVLTFRLVWGWAGPAW